MVELLAASAPPASSTALRALEVTVLALEQIVPWRYPPRREAQFGEWLRGDILAGVFEEPAVDHDLALLLTQARAHSTAIVGPAAQTLFDPIPKADLMHAVMDTVAQWREPADWAGDERNIILALARSWYTAITGAITPKDAAAAWLLDEIAPPYRRVLANARASYLGHEPDGLASHSADVAAFVAHARYTIQQRCSAASWQRANLQVPEHNQIDGFALRARPMPAARKPQR